jgi:hypothetical protein
MIFCTNIKSRDHYIDVHPKYENGAHHHIYLELDKVTRETSWIQCLLSTKSRASFTGTLVVDDDIKYENVQGSWEFNNHKSSIHYNIYNVESKLSLNFDASGSYLDAQNMFNGYVESDYLNKFIDSLNQPQIIEPETIPTFPEEIIQPPVEPVKDSNLNFFSFLHNS